MQTGTKSSWSPIAVPLTHRTRRWTWVSSCSHRCAVKELGGYHIRNWMTQKVFGNGGNLTSVHIYIYAEVYLCIFKKVHTYLWRECFSRGWSHRLFCLHIICDQIIHCNHSSQKRLPQFPSLRLVEPGTATKLQFMWFVSLLIVFFQ
jgi:hypothetical protein